MYVCLSSVYTLCIIVDICKTTEEKSEYLNGLFKNTYLNDIIERNKIQREDILESIINMLSSSVGSLTNPKKIYDTFIINFIFF